jgi:hypothetical protein
MSTKLLSETICRKGLMVKCFVALIVFCCSVGEAFAQTDTKVTINVNNVLIRTALDQLQKEAKIHFVYDEENIDSEKRVSLSYTETPLNAVLNDFCKQTSLRYEVKRNLILILPSKAEKTTGKHEPFYMTGVVMDETGESIIGATIMIGGTSQGTVTDIDGDSFFFEAYIAGFPMNVHDHIDNEILLFAALYNIQKTFCSFLDSLCSLITFF